MIEQLIEMCRHALSADMPVNEYASPSCQRPDFLERFEKEYGDEFRSAVANFRNGTPTRDWDWIREEEQIEYYLKNKIIYSLYKVMIDDETKTNYQHHGTRTDFLLKNNPNMGWKFHLNVTPENCQKVSDFLISQDYFHKFKNAILSDGKIFTVYVGSWKKALEEAEAISRELSDLLAKPIAEEPEFARGVVGRFVARPNREFEYPDSIYGLCLVAQDVFKDLTDSEYAANAYNKLRQEYGDYLLSES